MKVNKFILFSIIIILFIIITVILLFVFLSYENINSKARLIELLGMDFTDVNITDIKYKNCKEDSEEYTCILVFLKESDEVLKSEEYYKNNIGGGISDPTLEYIPPSDIEEMKEIGINIKDIQKHGGNYNEIKINWQYRPYEIHWYQLNKFHNGKSNVLLITYIPCKVVLNIDKIMQN